LSGQRPLVREKARAPTRKQGGLVVGVVVGVVDVVVGSGEGRSIAGDWRWAS